MPADDLARLAAQSGNPVVPIIELPKFASVLNPKNPAELRLWQEMDKQIEAWRKSIVLPSTRRTSLIRPSTTTGGGAVASPVTLQAGAQGAQGAMGPPQPPPVFNVDQDDEALMLAMLAV